MRNKTTHAKLLSLLLTLVMVLSTVVVFAENDPVEQPEEPMLSTEQNESGQSVTVEEPDQTAPEQIAPVEAKKGETISASIELSQTSVNLRKGASVTLTATPKDFPEDWEGEISWSSTPSDDSIVSVSDGVVTANASGTATVKASAMVGEDEVYAECIVTVIEPPAAPINVAASTRYGSNDNGLTVSWQGTADQFIVLRGTNPSNLAEYTRTNKNSVYWLENKGTFYYAVKAVKGGVESDLSNIASVSISGNILTNIEDLVWYGHTKKKVSIYKTAKLKGKVATLPKGTYVIAMGKSPAKVKKFKQPSKVLVMTSDGRVGWLKYNQLKGGVKAATTVSYDFTKSAVEDFVNSHGYSSPNKYLIWVSPRTQRAYLLTGKKGQWKYSRNFRVTTGRFSHLTKPYHSAISQKKAKVFMVTEKGKRYYYKYASYFASGVSFHTGTWWKSNNKVRGVMNSKGVPQTFGCLRMANGDAEWIYNNIPYNTTVIVKKDAYH